MSFVFFTDRDLGKQFPDILERAGITVERHDTHFSPTTRDEDWLRLVGEKGWIALSHDRRIRYKPNELAAVIASRVILVVVVGQAPFADLARSFVSSRRQLEGFLVKQTPPCIAKLYMPAASELLRRAGAPGRIEKWYP